jgi:hypothetical protein
MLCTCDDKIEVAGKVNRRRYFLNFSGAKDLCFGGNGLRGARAGE